MSASKKLHLKDCSFTRRGVRYPYYGIAESTFVDGKNQKKIIKYLGALTPMQAESYRNMLNGINEGKEGIIDIEDLEFEGRKDFLNVFVLHSLWEQLQLNKMFPVSPTKEVTTAQVAEILTIAKLLKPASNIKTVDWFNQTFLPNLLQIDETKYNRMKIFNELSLINLSQSSIEEHLLRFSRKATKGEFEIYFVDGTTTYFEGIECPLGRAGKDKTNGYKTHMILILLVTDKNGSPCVWDVFNGSEREISKFKDIAQRICRDYGVTNITFCFDRGFASSKNFNAIEGFLSHFISGLDKDQIANVIDIESFQIIKNKLLERSQAKDNAEKKVRMPIEGFYTADGYRFYKELGVKGDYRHIAGFNSEIHEAELRKREAMQLNVFLEIDKLNTELACAKKDRDLDVIAKRIEQILVDNQMQKIIKYTLVPTAVTTKKTHAIQSCKIKYSVEQEQWRKACLLDGLFIYITDHTEKKEGHFELTAYDITNHYKNKYVIEQDFRDLKNVINIRPLYVRLPEHVKALVNISIIAQFINIHIGQKLKQIEMPIGEFYCLLNKSSSVAFMRTPARTFKKLIRTEPRLIKALDILGVTTSTVSRAKMAILG